MDATRFDHLARSLSTAGTRRGLLSLLPALPIVGLLLARLDDEASAKKRRKKKVTLCHEGQTIRVRKPKRKKHLRHGDTPGACQPPPPCTPTTCAAQGKTCGTLDDGCGGTLNCGDCVSLCSARHPCPGGCCAGDGSCQPGNASDACGQAGTACVGCTAPQTCGGDGTAGVCGCTPTTCAEEGRTCGNLDDGCGGTLNCGSCGVCKTCDAVGQCVNLPNGIACDDSNACTNNTTCHNGACGGGTPVVCDTPPECRGLPGSCDPNTGNCHYGTLANGTPCGSPQCGDVCNAGTCVSTSTLCDNGECCDNATEVCFKNVCAIRCPAPNHTCPDGAQGCVQFSIQGQTTFICLCDRSDDPACNCTTNPEDTCPPGEACFQISSCDGCYEICVAP